MKLRRAVYHSPTIGKTILQELSKALLELSSSIPGELHVLKALRQISNNKSLMEFEIHILHFNYFVGQISNESFSLISAKASLARLILRTVCHFSRKAFLEYVFRRPIFQPHDPRDWEVPLAGRGGYVTATIMGVMDYQLIDIKMDTFDIGMLYRITNIRFHT